MDGHFRAGVVGTVIAGIVFETMGPNLSMTPRQMHDSFKNANGAVIAAGAFLLVQKIVLVRFAAGLATLVAARKHWSFSSSSTSS